MSMRARYPRVLPAILAGGLVACAGAAGPQQDLTDGIADQFNGSSTLWSVSYGLTDLVNDLQAAGLITEPAGGSPPSLLTAPIESLMVNGEQVAAREYPDEATAATEADWISPEGDQITHPDPDDPGSQIVALMEPAGTPHWFRNANMIVLYVGDSQTTLEGLSAALGPQFAGGAVPEEGAIPTRYGFTWELPAPSKVLVGDVQIPPAWVAVPGQAAAIPGSLGSFEIGVREGDQETTTHGDAAPPGPDALPTVTLADGESATIIVSIPFGTVREIDVGFGDWPREFVWPDFKQALAGTAEGHGDLYAYTLDPAGQLVDQIMLATLGFSHETGDGTVSFFWLVNPSAERLAESQAQGTLQTFFDHLRDGSYADAAELYGGGYETLVEYNPELDPVDRAGLFENACTINGFQCLRPMSMTLQSSDADSYVFVVEFETDDGSLFTLGPCCGDQASNPARSQFPFTVVVEADGAFRIQELPPYLP